MPSVKPGLRTLTELRTLYEIQPQLRDILVEGRDDARLIRWYLREHEIRKVQVYAVDDRVEIDSAKVFAAGGEVGPKGRILAVATEAANWVLLQDNITCIVDADRDCLGSLSKFAHLLITDVGSMDVYCFQQRPLQQFIDVVVSRNESASELITELVGPLNDLFLVRAALHEVGVAVVDGFANCFDPRLESALNVDELVRRSLAVARLGQRQGEVLSRVEQLRMQLPENQMMAIRGHDIGPLLIKRLRLKNEWARADVVEKALRGCLTVSDVDDYPLFSTLKDRVGPAGSSLF